MHLGAIRTWLLRGQLSSKSVGTPRSMEKSTGLGSTRRGFEFSRHPHLPKGSGDNLLRSIRDQERAFRGLSSGKPFTRLGHLLPGRKAPQHRSAGKLRPEAAQGGAGPDRYPFAVGTGPVASSGLSPQGPDGVLSNWF